MKKYLLGPLGIFLFLAAGTFLVILYALGYRFGFQNGHAVLSETGTLTAESTPNSAQIIIDNHPTKLTNNNIDLVPGTYDVKIEKEGYFPWEKKVIIKKQEVITVNPILFPIAPKLENITTLGADNPVIDPTLTKLAYTVASESAKNNGIYVLNLSQSLISLQSGANQIADETVAPFSTAHVNWSPDSTQIVASISSSLKTPTTYLLDAGSFNTSPQDVTETFVTTQTQWNKAKQDQQKVLLSNLPKKIRPIISDNTKVLAWAPDNTKILYQATNSASLPFAINPRMPGLNSANENRSLVQNQYYVYDIKLDQNYLLPVKDQSDSKEVYGGISWLRWFGDSKHVIYVHDNKIDIMDYDGTNQTTVYAGPFIDHYVFSIAQDPTRIIILTNLGNPSITPNLYALDLK